MSEQDLLSHAKALAESGDFESAEGALLARLNILPVRAETVLYLSNLYFSRLMTSEAVGVLERFRQLRPCTDALREYLVGERLNERAMQLLQSTQKSGSTDDLLDQAIMLQISGDAASAAALCRKVITLQPDNAFALNHLGRALFNTRQTPEAQRAFERAVQLQPGYCQAWHNLGHVLRAKNEIPAAEKAYRKAIDAAPHYQSALVNLGLVLMAQGKNDQAIVYLERAVALNPGNAEALLNLGICRQIQREYGLAENALQRAVEAGPAEPRALRHLGDLRRELQDGPGAVVCYRKALQISPEDGGLWAELISTLESMNELDEAQTTVGDALQRLPGDANIIFESAKISRRRGDNENALSALQKISPQALHPRLVQSFHYERANVLDRLGRYTEAFADYSQGNAMALTSIRARGTDKNSLLRQMDAVQQWLAKGAPAAGSGEDEDLGADLCFLIGFPRSGTTLLDVMLDGHSQVLSLEEQPTIERAAFRLDRLPGHYPNAMAALNRSQREELRGVYRDSIAGFRQPEHTLVLDKMPIRTIHAPFMHRLFPKAKFLFAERHPCDVVLSNFMQHYAINEAMIHFTQLSGTAGVYDRVMRIWQQSLATFPELSVHYVRYENLIDDTEGTLRGICGFLGLPWQSGLEMHQDSMQRRPQIKTNSYHQVAEPVYQRSKYRWLNYQPQLQPFMPVLAPHIERMGY
jgi:tetratricopeptide (TPR) repeat protein